MKYGCMILALALWWNLSGCSTVYISQKEMMEVQSGMTQKQVEHILGTPDYRRFDNGMEEWEYRRKSGTPVLFEEFITLIVGFDGGKVVHMNSFQRPLQPTPPPVMVAPLPTPAGDGPAGASPEEIRLMTSDEWSDFAGQLKRTFMSDDKKTLVAQMLQRYDVTSAQCVKIVKEFSFAPDRVEMAKQLYPYVTDKDNFNQVVDTLFSETHKERVRKFIEEYHPTPKK